MCSRSVSLLRKSDVFCTKNSSFNHPNQFKMYLISPFLGLLENIDVFCRKISENFDPFLISSFLAKFFMCKISSWQLI